MRFARPMTQLLPRGLLLGQMSLGHPRPATLDIKAKARILSSARGDMLGRGPFRCGFLFLSIFFQFSRFLLVLSDRGFHWFFAFYWFRRLFEFKICSIQNIFFNDFRIFVQIRKLFKFKNCSNSNFVVQVQFFVQIRFIVHDHFFVQIRFLFKFEICSN
jgi:hypothetical protein